MRIDAKSASILGMLALLKNKGSADALLEKLSGDALEIAKCIIDPSHHTENLEIEEAAKAIQQWAKLNRQSQPDDDRVPA